MSSAIHRSLWFDEAATGAFSSYNWPQLWQAIHHGDAFYVAYYSFMHAWIKLFGVSETSMRATSVLAAVATLPLLHMLVRRLLSRQIADISVVLLSCNIYFFWYAVEARPYALIIFLSALSTWAFIKALDERKMA